MQTTKLHLITLFVLGSSLIAPQSGFAEMTLGTRRRRQRIFPACRAAGHGYRALQVAFRSTWILASKYGASTTPFSLSSIGVPMNTTADVSTCTPGTNATAFQEAVLRRINWYRAMAGVPASVTLSDAGGDNSVILSWPASIYGYRLQSTSDLLGNVWVDVPATVTQTVFTLGFVRTWSNAWEAIEAGS
jgi:hypothetical protein